MKFGEYLRKCRKGKQNFTKIEKIVRQYEIELMESLPGNCGKSERKSKVYVSKRNMNKI